ncbi:MAG TPA: ATP-binding protein [Kofleriaceae bacterium]|nr:ATP-binding protein [Kofleriaceae bacterium]
MSMNQGLAAQDQLDALQRIGRALHSELDLERIVQRVTDEATAICRAHFGAFFYNVVDPRGERYTLYTLAGVPRERFSRFPMPRNTAIFAPTFHGESPVVRLDDVTKDPRYGKSAPHHGMPKGHLPVCSYLAVSVVARSGEVLGGLFFGHPEPGVFTKSDEEAVVGIAAHAAIAIENARLYEAEKRARLAADEARHAAEQAHDRMVSLQRLTVELSRPLGAEEAARVVIREMSELVGVEAAGVVLFDDSGARIERFVIDGDVDDEGARQAKELSIDNRAPIFDAARRRELIWLVGADEIDRAYPNLAALRALTGAETWGGVPIEFEGRALGAIGFHAKHRREVCADERSFLLAIGRQCGQAIERARLHDATVAARAEAEEASRAKDDFLAMLGHELRNPLSPILSAVQLMRIRGDTGSVREQDVIVRQVGHLIHLVDDLLDISRITRGKIELERKPHQLHTLVAKAVETASPLVRERAHHLIVTLPDHGLWVDADEVRLVQVVTNLLSNAAKYTDRGGTIEVRATRDRDAVTVYVRDTGTGIDPELLPRVFDPFVQGRRGRDRSLGGLGIGLALVRTLVEMHGGTVGARSDGPGRGSELWFRLPLLEMERAAPTPPEGERTLREHLQVAPRRILVVDDNVDAAIMLEDLLRSVGHEVRSVHDASAALAEVASFAPTVAVLDIGLPGMDGYELAATIRARGGMLLIAVTGYGQEHDRARAERAGFDLHFTKPVAIAKLLTAIEMAP